MIRFVIFNDNFIMGYFYVSLFVKILLIKNNARSCRTRALDGRPRTLSP